MRNRLQVQIEQHRSGRTGWLRVAVLGSDNAIVSTASLMIGVAAASASKDAGFVASVAGAMSRAGGEYFSVNSQRDAEQADIKRENGELISEPQAELEELTPIYVELGLENELALKVAAQLSTHDRLGTHMRDELGIDRLALARPWQAAWVSAVSFALFALVPIVAWLVAPIALRVYLIAALSLASLAVLGAFGGYLGGAPMGRATLRVAVGKSLAMTVTALIGKLVGLTTI